MMRRGGERMYYEKDAYPGLREFDFMPVGQAIKKAREARGITREQLAEMLDYAPRHIQSIENEGQHPSLQLFIQLVRFFDLPVDQFIFPDEAAEKSAVRRQVNMTLNRLNDRELTVIEATAQALVNARNNAADD